MSHTPGPWSRVANSIKSRKADCVVVRLPAYTDCSGDETPEQLERWDADARLIAAAPELLEALEELADQYQYINQFDSFYEQARAAIAKAKGR
tara:strand:+ start:3348 stop:3626 length:279 start_codon:yes stop_codon:yes gene_type:complete